MKNAVIKYGLISGAISAALLFFVSMVFYKRYDFSHGFLIGYSCMLLSFFVIYFGMANYRDHVGGGQINYWRALSIGLLITVISCICYSLAWIIISNTMLPDFMDKCCAYMVDEARQGGASAAKIDAKIAETNNMKELLKNPVMAFLMYSIEPTPVGIIVSVVCAFLVRLKKRVV